MTPETVIVGLTLKELALRMGFVDALDLHQIFMGRAVGAVFGPPAVLFEMHR